MTKHVNRVGASQRKRELGGKKRHRREHWLIDNQIYFITARCRDGLLIFEDEQAAEIFWNRFDHHTLAQQITPIVTSLVGNHYHLLAHVEVGANVPVFVRNLHGSTAKLTNDLREAAGLDRISDVWANGLRGSYFDGCVRNATQFRRIFRYVERQGVRHGLVRTGEHFPHTRVNVSMERALKRALERNSFLPWSDKTRWNPR